MTEDEIVEWHHRLDEHEFEQAPSVGDGQGSLVCCSPCGHKELDMTERLNKNIQSEVSQSVQSLSHVPIACSNSRPSSW